MKPNPFILGLLAVAGLAAGWFCPRPHPPGEAEPPAVAATPPAAHPVSAREDGSQPASNLSTRVMIEAGALAANPDAGPNLIDDRGRIDPKVFQELGGDADKAAAVQEAMDHALDRAAAALRTRATFSAGEAPDTVCCTILGDPNAHAETLNQLNAELSRLCGGRQAAAFLKRLYFDGLVLNLGKQSIEIQIPRQQERLTYRIYDYRTNLDLSGGSLDRSTLHERFRGALDDLPEAAFK